MQPCVGFRVLDFGIFLYKIFLLGDQSSLHPSPILIERPLAATFDTFSLKKNRCGCCAEVGPWSCAKDEQEYII